MEVKKLGIKLVYVDYTKPIKELLKLIKQERLNIIAGPPSLLEEISKYLVKVDLLISYAEVLSDDRKRILEDRFKTKVIEIYQGSEGFLASTCQHGKLHLNEDVIKFDFEKIGNKNKVIITDLYRKTQPIFRYSINDYIELDDNECTCGSCFRVVKKIHGRVDDIFIVEGRDGKDKLLFPDYVRRSIIQASEDILDYQAIQWSRDKIEIRLVTDKKVEKEIIKNLTYWTDKLDAKLGKVKFVYKKPEYNKNSKKMIRIMRRWK